MRVAASDLQYFHECGTRGFSPTHANHILHEARRARKERVQAARLPVTSPARERMSRNISTYLTSLRCMLPPGWIFLAASTTEGRCGRLTPVESGLGSEFDVPLESLPCRRSMPETAEPRAPQHELRIPASDLLEQASDLNEVQRQAAAALAQFGITYTCGPLGPPWEELSPVEGFFEERRP